MRGYKSLLLLFLAGASAGSVAAEPEDAPPAPEVFVTEAALDSLAEVELGKIALSKSQDPDVRKFAERMVSDHGKTNQELVSLARSKGIVAPTQLDAEHRTMIANLEREEGVAFERAYCEHMVMDHTRSIALFESASKSPDPELSGFAKQKLPALKEHQQLARKLPD